MTAADDVLDLEPATEPVPLVPAPDTPAAAHAKPKIANVPGRLGTAPVNGVRSLFGMPWSRRLSKASLLIPRIRQYEAEYLDLDADGLKEAAVRLKGRARGGANLDAMIPAGFGLACAAIRRVHGFQPFDVQLAAGVVMHYGGLVELATGEGKTLCAVAPTFLNALPGRGVHVTTVNDYLAQRDAAEM